MCACVRVCLCVGKAPVTELTFTLFQVAELTDVSARSGVICAWCACENLLSEAALDLNLAI